MRFAYADPPYLGCGKRLYGDQHERAGDYDTIEAHEALLVRLREEFPDGWAVSLHVPSLEEYLHMSRRVIGKNAVRVGSWVKPFASWKTNPGYSWEPVLFYGGRKLKKGAGHPTVRDYVSANITLRRTTKGAKPDAFSFWIFDFLGARHDDEIVDLFPGSGAVGLAWEKWQKQTRMFA